MIGVVVVVHGGLADEFAAATEHGVGPMDGCLAVCVAPADVMEMGRADIRQAIADAARCEGVLVITDMFGGTPSNLSISVMEAGRVEVIAGVNLPMLIKLAGIRSVNDMEKALFDAQEAGRKYINVASRLLTGK